MSAIARTPNRGRRAGAGKGKGGNRVSAKSQLYSSPLPLVFVDSTPFTRGLRSLLGLSATEIINPHVKGYLDVATKSVWITNETDSMILWRRGFFGKGDLSRSEPSWLARQLNDRQMRKEKQMTSEEVTAKRRAERKQFKIDRAKAIAAVAQEAESKFENEGLVIVPTLSGPSIPSQATWRPAPREETPASSSSIPTDTTSPTDAEAGDDEPIVNIEHLQLTLSDAFFLIWNLDCLTVLDPATDEPLSLEKIWMLFQQIHLEPFHLSLSTMPRHPPPEHLTFDNPFLINYVVVHHYRSLGWVIKGGLKFCVDYLLYKRGPVFSHAEFALVLCPVYEDPEDQASSQFVFPNTKPFEWSWLSTINRVNSQVMKTLILVYVTIPAKSRVSTDILKSPACFQHYSIREITVRRFIPARMRD